MELNDKSNNKVILIGVALIAMVFIFTFFRSELFKKNSENEIEQKILNYPKITSEDFKNKLKSSEDLKILDIRSSDDYAMEHLANSINAVSEESINAISKEKTIIIVGYSTEDEEYTKIIDYLKKNKYYNFFILKGGFDAWKNIGGGTISIGNPNSFVDNSKINYIAPEDLKAIVENKNYPKYIIDMRPKQSFDDGHIFGAENIFLDELEKSADKIPFSKEIYIYGDTEFQGFQAGVRLYDLGFMLVKVLKGGLTSWKDKGFEIVK
ncbi:MAG: rhodanese-like domain-containing protein [Parcubacteria group bacterium]|jgi:hydroxyacylglutathione hydrolase